MDDHPSQATATSAAAESSEYTHDLTSISAHSPVVPQVADQSHPDIHPKAHDAVATEDTTANPAHQSEVRQRLQLSQNRLLSLDLLRGLAIFVMITVNAQIGDTVFPILEHPEWIGFSVADTVFPSFLFITGCTMPLSIRAAPHSPNNVYARHALRVFKRSVIIWGLGVILNLYGLVQLHVGADQFRWPNVLNRIGFCYLVVGWMHVLVLWRGRLPEKPLSSSYLFTDSSPVHPHHVNTHPVDFAQADVKREMDESPVSPVSPVVMESTHRAVIEEDGEDDHGVWPWFLRVTLPYYLPIFCLVVWLICTYSVRVEGCPEKGMVTVPECSAQAYFDLKIFGEAHTYRHLAFDPEGSLSTLTSILNVWFGWFIGCTVHALNAQVKQVTSDFKAHRESRATSRAELTTTGTSADGMGVVGDGHHHRHQGSMSSTWSLKDEILEQETLTRIYNEHLSQWFWWGILWMFIGWVFSLGLPLSKPSWTATFAVMTSGLSQTVLSILFFKFDAQPKTKRLRQLHLEHQQPYRSNNQLSRHYRHHSAHDTEASVTGTPARSNYSSALNIYFKVDYFFRHWFRKAILLVLGSMGRNAILLYMCSELVQGTCSLIPGGPADPETGEVTDLCTAAFTHTWGALDIGGWASLFYSLGFTFLHVALAIFLDYKKWYFKV